MKTSPFKNKAHQASLFLVTSTGTLLMIGTSQAATVFTEDFESPDVSAVTGGLQVNGTIPSNWVGSNQGFGGNRRGITDKAGGDFSAADPNTQAFAFRYTNSGLTTASGLIGTLTIGETITVSTDVVRDDGGAAGTAYSIQLIAFAPGAARNDARSTPAGSTVLATLAGNATGDGNFSTVTFDFTPDAIADASELGKDIGVRFIGASSSATIDNISVDISTIPEPSVALFAGFAALGLIFYRHR